ncbi:HPr family phosphocarrier protein [Slackia heliotrinireducens]|uniref:Phosphotransferase system HPr (HPr) family protein n=1 Tax=Slackia heliotrinireducens (strain ATCC 29202 / DSM 20476 / NCTC 11029 / RHS 1) TaxID=471855 RepID=C7N616_SLAHD|nr:HPr family phosphocarrier protein [Slackia heliotrinireducens]ACV22351.1 phosphotransferase system HPr (HPr) family protein [Slackia heliotrinireducens DSM 20476]VEH00606.1 Phosphocarrier protein HPr [Slackia heliotrinireducens]
MVSKTVTLINPQGFHMRPAGIFAGNLAKFESSVKLVKNGVETDAKSLMGIMAACIKCGDTIDIVADGPDEAEALACAAEAIESGLGDL